MLMFFPFRPRTGQHINNFDPHPFPGRGNLFMLIFRPPTTVLTSIIARLIRKSCVLQLQLLFLNHLFQDRDVLATYGHPEMPYMPLLLLMTYFQQCANYRCIVKGGAQESPLFKRFSGSFVFLRSACSLGIPARKPSNLVKSPILCP